MKLFLTISITALLITGCSSTIEYKSATSPISEARADMVVDGETTKIDLISMFGKPNGVGGAFSGSNSIMANIETPNKLNTNKHSEIISYSDCVLGSGAKSSGLWSAKGESKEICKVFSALLDKNNIVIAHKYTNNHSITKDKISLVKPNISTKKDVVRFLAGPNSIEIIGDKVLFLYKTCVTKVSGSLFNRDQNQNCQHATIVIDNNTNIVSKVNFVPFL